MLEDEVLKNLESSDEYDSDDLDEEEDACYMEFDNGITLIDPKSIQAFEGLNRKNVIMIRK